MPSDIHSKRAHLYTIQDLAEYHPPAKQSIIHDGVLDLGTRLMLFGEAGTWKSNLAIHAAYCIAVGRRWLGFNTSPANILYVQGEMTLAHTKERIEKYCTGTKNIFLSNLGSIPAKADDISYPPHVVTEAIEFLHLDESSGYESVKQDIIELIRTFPRRPVVLIIDPFYKVFRHDLIKADEVKYFLDNMDLLRLDKSIVSACGGVSIILIHHAKKPTLDRDGNPISAGTSDMFGSAGLDWWADTIMRTELEEHDESKSTIKIAFTKHSRVSAGYLPKEIVARWDKELLHPRILSRRMPQFPEEEVENRGDLNMMMYE